MPLVRDVKIIHQKRNYTSLRVQHRFGKKLRSRAVSPMSKDNTRKASLLRRRDEVCSNASTFWTGVSDVMYAHAVAVNNTSFSDIKRRLLVVIENAPQFIDGLVLREYCFARRRNQKKRKDDGLLHSLINIKNKDFSQIITTN